MVIYYIPRSIGKSLNHEGSTSLNNMAFIFSFTLDIIISTYFQPFTLVSSKC